MEDEHLPPRPGEAKAGPGPLQAGPIPLYVRGATIPLTEAEALGVIAQLSSALQTRGAGLSLSSGWVARNG